MTHGHRPPFLLRDPTCSKTHIAFGYGGNIWSANRDGSDLRRLTSVGQESKPAFSPDGMQIAFIGEYGGPRGVFVIPRTGGQPRRLTYHPADLGNAVTGNSVGWTPDGEQIVFTSHRNAFAGGEYPVVQLFVVPAEGGFASPLPLHRATEGSLSPDAARIAYVPHLLRQPECKRYRGGQARFIWIADLVDSKIVAKIPRDLASDFNPIWVGETIYFLSDRAGPVTLFAYDVKSERVTQVVTNDGLDIKSASACADAIVYEQFGSLHLLNLKSGADCVLDIQPVADFPEARPHTENIGNFLVTGHAPQEVELIKPRLAPHGERAVFGVRGRIVTVPVGNGDPQVLTKGSGIAERDPAWSPDGQYIAYFSDESGEYALHIRSHSGFGAVRKIHLGLEPSFFFSPIWSPDSKKVAYTDKRLNYWYVDLQKGRPVRVDTDLFTDPNRGSFDLDMAWSPDSRWIAYSKQLPSHLHAIFIYSLEEGTSEPLTDGMSDARSVAFDKNGHYLYFTASTDIGLATGWIQMSSFRRAVTRSVYAIPLRRNVANPLASLCTGRDSETTEQERLHEGASQENNVACAVELEDVVQRIVRLPLPARNYYGLFTGQPGVLFLYEGPEVDEPYISLLSYAPRKVHRFELKALQSELILEGILHFDLSYDGERMIYARQQDVRREWFITAAQKPDDASAQQGLIKIGCIETLVEPRAEWRQLYQEVWRQERDFFYDPHLHGLNLERTKKTYEPFLENIVTREELDYLFNEMLANLTCLHMVAVRHDARKAKRSTIGLLGADYDLVGDRYRISRIYERDPWNPESRSPLREPGVTVRVGEYLLAVDGSEVVASADVHSYFAHTAGRQVVLMVGPSADGSNAREMVVEPIENEYALRYFAWVEGNRRRVDELTDGRVAYVHLPDTGLSGYAAFNRYFFAQVGKDALIVDGRYNNGGQGPDYIIDCLRRSLWCNWHMREGQDIEWPLLTIAGPKVMLINETSGSMGDCLPWLFRRAGLGPLVGTRTWGGLVGQYLVNPDLMDGGYIGTPNLAFYTREGAWEIENVGVSPDIEVEDDPRAARSGHDVQLEKAVEAVMDSIGKTPRPTVPQHPPYPNYHSHR